jgi:hypothetical protein
MIYYLEGYVKWLIAQMYWVLSQLSTAFNYIWVALQAFAGWIKAGALLLKDGFLRAIRALAHLDFRSIWNALKRGFDRLRRAFDWYMRRVQAPLDRIRNQIWGIYRTFFKPIIQVIDSFRVMVRFIALFNRKLAAKLDSRLFSLESKLMSPITAILKRVNELSSYQRGVFTALGYLDRVLFLETLRRDASLAWEILTNPRARIYEKPTPPAAHTYHDLVSDVRLYSDTGTGPVGDYVREAIQAARDTLVEVS